MASKRKQTTLFKYNFKKKVEHKGTLFLILLINRPLCARLRAGGLIKEVRTAFRVILSAIQKFKKPNKKLSVLKSL